MRRYLNDETPIGQRRATVRATPVRDAVTARVLALLPESGSWTAGKQRLTATRLHQMLRAEGSRSARPWSRSGCASGAASDTKCSYR